MLEICGRWDFFDANINYFMYFFLIQVLCFSNLSFSALNWIIRPRSDNGDSELSRVQDVRLVYKIEDEMSMVDGRRYQLTVAKCISFAERKRKDGEEIRNKNQNKRVLCFSLHRCVVSITLYHVCLTCPLKVLLNHTPNSVEGLTFSSIWHNITTSLIHLISSLKNNKSSCLPNNSIYHLFWYQAVQLHFHFTKVSNEVKNMAVKSRCS